MINVPYLQTYIHLLSVSSSEKVDKWARYADFQIASMPYPGTENWCLLWYSWCVVLFHKIAWYTLPLWLFYNNSVKLIAVWCISIVCVYCIGCEFFKDYRDNGYNPVCLQYDWSLVRATHLCSCTFRLLVTFSYVASCWYWSSSTRRAPEYSSNVSSAVPKVGSCRTLSKLL